MLPEGDAEGQRVSWFQKACVFIHPRVCLHADILTYVYVHTGIYSYVYIHLYTYSHVFIYKHIL